MKLHVVSLSKAKGGWADEAVSEYGKRTNRYLQIRESRLKPTNGRDPDEVRGRDAARVMKLIGERDWLVALDERGRDLTSEGLAELIDEAIGSGVGELVFCIGGPFGHDESVRRASKRVVRLSKMVLNHQVARVMLAEQLYRACAIRAGHPYHHTD